MTIQVLSLPQSLFSEISTGLTPCCSVWPCCSHMGVWLSCPATWPGDVQECRHVSWPCPQDMHFSPSSSGGIIPPLIPPYERIWYAQKLFFSVELRPTLACFACMVGPTKNQAPNGAKLWGGASFIVGFRVYVLSMYCIIGPIGLRRFLDSPSVHSTIDDKTASATLRWHFWSPIACPVVFTTRSLLQLGRRWPSWSNKIMNKMWWQQQMVWSAENTLFIESWHQWLKHCYFAIMNHRDTSIFYFDGAPWFFHGFSRVFSCVSHLELLPTSPCHRCCGGWLGRGSWQGWRWRPQLRTEGHGSVGSISSSKLTETLPDRGLKITSHKSHVSQLININQLLLVVFLTYMLVYTSISTFNMCTNSSWLHWSRCECKTKPQLIKHPDPIKIGSNAKHIPSKWWS